jgi:pleckstrin homology domain-containing family M member 1
LLSVPLDLSDATSSLCSTIEAIFIHGIKDSLFQNTLSILESDVDRRPNPSFWSFLCKFLHSHGIQELKELSQVNTKVGFCRAFIRKSLNENLLSSYFNNIRTSPLSTLKGYYHNYAFLYDNELTEIVENLLLGTESYISFNLPLNSSLLNKWNDAPLSLSGIYVVPLRSLPFSIGEDIAGSITSTSHTQNIRIPIATACIPDIYAESISNSIFSQSPLSLDKDDKFERFLVKATEASNDDSIDVKSDVDEDSEEIGGACGFPLQSNDDKFVMGNSITDKQSWSEPTATQDEEEVEPEIEQIEFKRSQSIRSNALDEHSYRAIFNEKQHKDTLNFQEIWSKFQRTVEINNSSNESMCDENEEMPEGFEVVKRESSSDYRNLQKMVETLCRLPNECGLDNQSYLCYDCRTLLGVDLSKANLCNFDGHYYCSACISNDKYQIPSRIIYNWDFDFYKVSKKASTFLTDYQFKPFLDFKVSF